MREDQAELFGLDPESIPKEQTVTYPSLSRVTSAGIPSILGLRLHADTRHFTVGSSTVKIQCLASVGLRKFEAEKHVHMTHVNNQRLSAGDLRNVNNTGCILRLNYIVIVIVFIVIST
ncbi:hypothetical protein PV327_002799 [Microctonus hyperodae]|uniref:Uncharacterized protein n=1 Tax=Microctonus hyperodae TaxID=165561 RepID=A0AA39FGA4_MICHY|nr:hypothetical protein PV327_002799 [Microctonus hyperodae]